MHVFFVPSWYPHPREPTSGIFQRDQALAIADLRPDWRVTVFAWGQGELTVPLSVPRSWPAVARDLVRRAPTGRRELLPNLVELRRPVVTWSPRLARGRVAAVVEAARRALDDAERAFGPVDLVHAHVSFPGGWVARALGRPYVVTEHMGPFPFPAFLRNGALTDEVAAPLADARVRMAVSRALARDMERLGSGPVAVVPNLVDERFLAPRPEIRAATPTVFFLGRLEAAKGLPELLEAAAMLPAGFEVRLAGSGAFPVPAGLPVRVLGRLAREQVRAELQRATCVVLPSRHESFGVVLAEAIACGTPVVATRCGGPEDIVTPGNGVLVPVRDADALAAALADVAARPFDTEQIRADFLARFSRPAVVDLIERRYREAA